MVTLVLMAGGKGVRLRPLTYDTPKPMIKISGKPILEHTIELAKSQGIKDIIICSGYLSHVIEEYFGDGSKFGVNIKYSIEKEPLGTGGPLSLIKNSIDDDFIVLNADIMCNINIKKLIEFHKKNNADATIIIHDTDHPDDSDLIEADGIKLKKIWLKPHKEKPTTKKSVAGMYVLNPKVISLVPDKKFSLERELLPILHEKQFKVCCYDTNEFLKDVGTFDRIKKIEDDYRN